MNKPRPRILIYVPEVDQTWGGIRQYTCTLIALLSKLKTYEFFIFHNSNDPEILRVSENIENISLINKNSVSTSLSNRMTIRFKNFVLKVINKIFKLKVPLIEINHLQEIVQALNIVIVHTPYQFLPDVENTKRVTTIHDVQELYYPEFFTPNQRAYRAREYSKATKQSSHIVVSYNHVKNDLMRFFQVPAEMIDVILLQMDNHWVCKMTQNNLIDLKQYNLPEKYLLYPANAWSHKNHDAIIEAVNNATQQGVKIHVVFTGNFNNAQGELLKKKIIDYALEKQIVIMGIVDENTLYSLYCSCAGVVVPTLYEAGSFPLMEAILLGIPVICSNVTSLPETIGNDDFIFDANDINDVCSKMISLYSDETYRQHSKANAISRRDSIIHTLADEKFARIYQSLL